MNKAMYAAASGMAAEQAKLDVIAGNLANADAVGFKASAMEFAELTDGSRTLGASERGTFVRFDQGKLVKGGGAFDLAIEGNGFFAVHRPDGSTVYTRDGRFSRGSDGALRDGDGNVLPGVKLPADVANVSVARDGRVTGDTGTAKTALLGHVRVATFAAPDALRSIGGTSFVPTAASGAPHVGEPGKRGAGTLAFGMVERSNVSIMTEMMEILGAQRAFEADSKGVQAADEMQRIANNINRS
jgi:flagellar basal-body rod protein FlgG